MAATQLANQPKSVRAEAVALARNASQKMRLKVESAARVKVPFFATAGGAALGLLERLAELEPDVMGVDNGVVAGLPLAVGGALLPPKWKVGEYLMLAGAGMLASGARTTVRELGAGGSTTEGVG